MALFGRGGKENPKEAGEASQARPVMARQAFCRICNKQQPFTRCWMRAGTLGKCLACGTAFPDPAALYRMTLPVCPACGEFLEQPGFEYGLCDGCGSKYEIVVGSKPCLLPNRRQRAEMDKVGRTWRRE